MQLFAVTLSALSSKCRKAFSHATQLQTALRATKSGASALPNQLKIDLNRPLQAFKPFNPLRFHAHLPAMPPAATSASIHCFRAASAPSAAPTWMSLSLNCDLESSKSSRKAPRLPLKALVACAAKSPMA